MSPISSENVGDFHKFFVEFIDSCQPVQIRLASGKFALVCKRFKEQVMQLKVPIKGVSPLRTALRKLQPSTEHLTPLHSEFVLLCLLSKNYKAALSVLNDDIFEVDQPKELFLYYYYGGMIYIGMKRFDKALEHLLNVVTAPMMHLNAIAIEAYKKYILVSLILNGQVPSFPKFTSTTVYRHIKNHTQVYLDLAKQYDVREFSSLEQFIQQYSWKFQRDNNMGLINQALSSLYKHNILRLTQTYLTLSLQDIANSVHLGSSKEAEMHVLRMIQDGEIFATINQKDGMVSFNEDPEQYKTCEMIDKLGSSIPRIMALTKKLSTLEEQISCDPAYVTKGGRDRTRFDFDDFDSVPHKFL